MAEESYRVHEFTTEDWWFRPPQTGEGELDFKSLRAIHRAAEGVAPMVDDRIDLDVGFWFAVHRDGERVTIYSYELDGYLASPSSVASDPLYASPMFLIIATTFDGARETQAAPCFTGNLKTIAAAALAIDGYLHEKGWVL